MRILHTSDWHIGKRLMGRERLKEQSAVLDEIVQICDREEVELVLIAGDIFDTYLPSAEAEDLFFTKIKAVAGKERAVVLISGNHDDGVRLSASAPLSEELGIYIVGNLRREIPLTSHRKVRPVRAGKGFAVFENERGERAFINALPYPNEARFKEEKSDLPFSERMKKWIDEGEEGNTEHLPSVFLSHIFVAGGVTSESEREIDLGGARAVPLEVLPKCDYIALGHLHKRQHMGKGNCYYSGSPLQYSFDEANGEKGVKIFDLTEKGVENLRDVFLMSGRKLVRLEADSPARRGGALVPLSRIACGSSAAFDLSAHFRGIRVALRARKFGVADRRSPGGRNVGISLPKGLFRFKAVRGILSFAISGRAERGADGVIFVGDSGVGGITRKRRSR